MAKHVTILGRAEAFCPLPPGEVWGVNGLPRTPQERRRITRQFQLHPLRVLASWEARALRQFPLRPTYTLRASRRYPHAVAYPLRAVPPGPRASSFDYMMALAISEHFTSILLTGIDYHHGTLRERLCEHVSLAYWIGLARGRGITVQISPRSTLLKFPYRYGFDYVRERRWGQAQGRRALQCSALDDGPARPRRVAGLRARGRRPTDVGGGV